MATGGTVSPPNSGNKGTAEVEDLEKDIEVVWIGDTL